MFGYLYTDDDQYLQQLINSAQQDQPYDVIWPIPPYAPFSPARAMGANVILSKRQRYWIPKAAMMEAVGVERLAPIPPPVDDTWDDVSESSFQQPDYYKDHLSDEGEEKVLLLSALISFDTDAEPQFPQPGWYNDQIDERSFLFFIPVREIDNDAEQQFLWPEYYKDHLTEENEDLAIAHPFATLLNFWDNDVDNQIPYQQYTIDTDLMDTGVEKITVITGYDTDADQQLSQLPYNLDRELADVGVEKITFVTGYDTDAENQFLQPPWYNDIIEERNELPIIPIVAYDTDADAQKLWPEYYKDHLSDEGVELKIVPTTVSELYAWDNDGENQIPYSLYQLDMDLMDTGVEKITTPAAWDTDSDQQLPQPLWSLDVFDEQHKLPIIPIVAYDTDADQQFQQPGWINDYQDFDLYQFIAPIVFVVPMIYNLIVHPEQSIQSVTVSPSISIQGVLCNVAMSLQGVVVI